MNLLSAFARGDFNGIFLSPWNCSFISICEPSLKGTAISLNDHTVAAAALALPLRPTIPQQQPMQERRCNARLKPRRVHAGLSGMLLEIPVLFQHSVCKSQHDFKMLDVLPYTRAYMPSIEPVHFDGFTQCLELLFLHLDGSCWGACIVVTFNNQYRGLNVFGVGDRRTDSVLLRFFLWRAAEKCCNIALEGVSGVFVHHGIIGGGSHRYASRPQIGSFTQPHECIVAAS